jgi:hypothetical protein
MQEGSAMRGIEVWEVVIDLAEDPPRFASIRDCTLLPIASALAEQERTDQVTRGERGRVMTEAVIDDELESDVASTGGDMQSDQESQAFADSGSNPTIDSSADESVVSGAGAGSAGDAARPPAPRPWRSPAADAVRTADAARRAENDQRQAAQRERDAQGAWKPAGTAAPEARQWTTLADREKQSREADSRGWSTLADRERADREDRSGKWKTLADRERDDRDARSKEWKSLGEQESERREARDAEERARRKEQWASTPQKFRTKRWDDKDVPADPAGVASRAQESGKDEEQATASGSSTGGLSGRWRRRSDSSP